MAETQGSRTVSTKLKRIAEIAKQMSRVALTSLSHHIDMDWMREAYRRTRKDGAVGVDEQAAADYAVNLEENLESLLDRAKSGDHYRAPPVRGVHIPKGNDGKQTRPIGIPSFEDKVLQRAVTMVLEAVYEQDFLECSHGFRPRRSAHGALESVWQQAMALSKLRNWVERDWFKWLRRRSREAWRNWEWMLRLLTVFPLEDWLKSTLPRRSEVRCNPAGSR